MRAPSRSSTSAPRSTIASTSAVNTPMPLRRSGSVRICSATWSKVGSWVKRTVTRRRSERMKPAGERTGSGVLAWATTGVLR